MASQPGQYTPQVSALDMMPRRQQPYAPNTSVGPGLQAVGSALGAASDVVRSVEAQDAAVYNSNAMASTRTTWTQEMLNRQTQYKNGDDLIGSVAKDFEAYKAKVLSSAPKAAQKQLAQQLTMYGANLTQASMQFQAKAQVEGRIDTWNQGAEQAKIHVSTTPQDFEDSYREQLQGLNALQIDEGVKTTLASRLKSDMAINASEAIAKQNPDAVLSALKKDKTGNLALDSLSVEQRGQIENFANAELRQRESDKRQRSNELAADTKARITDLSASYRAGLPVDPKVELTPGQIEAAFPGQGMELWKDLQKDKRMGMDLKQMGQLNPQELSAVVNRYAPQGGAGAADAIARRGEILQAAQQSIVERQKDPRGFAIQNGMSKPIDFSQPQAVLSELQSRAANAVRTMEQIGIPAPLLSAPEMQQMSRMLDNSTPSQKALWLGTLSTKLDSPAYQALMNQVLPNNPIASIVGSKIGEVNSKQPASWFDQKFSGDVTGPEKILAGEKLLSGKEEGSKGFPMPTEHNNSGSGTRDYFAREVGTLFSDRPQLGEATYGAFRSAYAGLLAEAGDFSGNGQRSLMKKALEMAVGSVQEYKGRNVSVPQGMDPSRFNGLVKNAVVAAAKDSGAPSDFEDRISGYQLKELGSLGSGRYQLVQGNAPLVRPDGKGFFIIDLRQQYGQK